jgi:hypothetical protein
MNEAKKEANLDGWADFSGTWLKVDLVKTFPLVVVPTKVEAVKSDDGLKFQLVITFEYLGKEWKLGLNKTNQTIIRQANLAPKEIIGCKLTFDKTKARNPTSNSLVDSFILSKVERTK